MQPIRKISLTTQVSREVHAGQAFNAMDFRHASVHMPVDARTCDMDSAIEILSLKCTTPADAALIVLNDVGHQSWEIQWATALNGAWVVEPRTIIDGVGAAVKYANA